MNRAHGHPVIIGIVGDSAAGKTTLAAGIAEALGANRAVNICIDDYHRYDRKQRSALGLTPHDPECNYMDILEQHVALLRAGEPILKPVYNHNGGILEPPEYVEPKEFIILEGLLGFLTPKLRDAFDVKIYLEPEEALRLRWKFARDTSHGGYTVEQVMSLSERLKYDSAHYILPQRAYADMIVGFYTPDDHSEESGAGLNVRHILKPTLPYYDFTPLLEIGGGGLELDLTRDVDGRPADALHIFGAVGTAQAAALKDHLWRQIPDRPNPLPEIGAYDHADEGVRHSPALALCQLLITHYVFNAARASEGRPEVTQ